MLSETGSVFHPKGCARLRGGLVVLGGRRRAGMGLHKGSQLLRKGLVETSGLPTLRMPELGSGQAFGASKIRSVKLRPEEARSGKLRIVEGRSVKLRPGEARSVKLRPDEARSGKMRFVEARSVKLRPVEARSGKMRPVEARSVKMRAVEARSGKLRLVEARSVKMRREEARSVKNSSVEIRPAQIAVAQVEALVALALAASRPPAQDGEDRLNLGGGSLFDGLLVL